jgi:hypothetical protein
MKKKRPHCGKGLFSSHQKILFPRIDNPAVDIPGQVRNTCKSTGKEKERP